MLRLIGPEWRHGATEHRRWQLFCGWPVNYFYISFNRDAALSFSLLSFLFSLFLFCCLSLVARIWISDFCERQWQRKQRRFTFECLSMYFLYLYFYFIRHARENNYAFLLQIFKQFLTTMSFLIRSINVT